MIGPHATRAELAALRRAVLAEPSRFIGQQTVRLSTVPTVMADGRLAPRHVDLRPFAVFGETIRVIPGGLTRVAMTAGSMLVNSSMGGGSKDTWVLEAEGDHGGADEGERLAVQGERLLPTLPELQWSSRWTGQAQQQQQAIAGAR